MRIFVAFLVAPIVSVLAAFLLLLTLQLFAEQQLPTPGGIGDMALLLSAFGLPVAYVMTVLFGLPAFFALRKARIVRRSVTVAVAAAIGGLFVVLIEAQRVLTFGDGSSFSSSSGGCASIVDNVRTLCGYSQLLQQVGFFAIAGGLSGLAFWTIYRGRGPT